MDEMLDNLGPLTWAEGTHRGCGPPLSVSVSESQSTTLSLSVLLASAVTKSTIVERWFSFSFPLRSGEGYLFLLLPRIGLECCPDLVILPQNKLGPVIKEPTKGWQGIWGPGYIGWLCHQVAKCTSPFSTHTNIWNNKSLSISFEAASIASPWPDSFERILCDDFYWLW